MVLNYGQNIILIQQDIWDTREYKKECVQEMRRYDDQQGWV